MNQVINEFKAFRESLGINQGELSKKLGVSQACVSQIEHGKRMISDKMLRKYEEIGFVKSKNRDWLMKDINTHLDRLPVESLITIRNVIQLATKTTQSNNQA